VASARVRKLSRDLHRQRGPRARGAHQGRGHAGAVRAFCVYRSLGHIYAQVIDDRSGNTPGFRQLPSTGETKKNLKGGGKHRGGKR